jgi:hypothetical protein
MEDLTIRLSKDDATVLRDLLTKELRETEREDRNRQLRSLLEQLDAGGAGGQGAAQQDITRPDAF